jgi:hypothetical protein
MRKEGWEGVKASIMVHSQVYSNAWVGVMINRFLFEMLGTLAGPGGAA